MDRRPPRVLFIGSDDWANVSNRVARAMNVAAGEVVARVCTMHAHKLGYHEDMVVDKGSHRSLFDVAAEADWIISTGDGDYSFLGAMLALLPLKKDVRRATCHVGSAYREKSVQYNAVDRHMGFDVRFIGADLYRFTASDPMAVPYFAPPDPIFALQYGVHSDGDVVISHSPTSRKTKGTDQILEVLRRHETFWKVDLIEGVSYAECVRRRSCSHIFVDQMSEIGGFGASSVEAMSEGCVVLSDLTNVVPEVWKFFPRPPIISVMVPSDLERELLKLVGDNEYLEQCRRKSVNWIEANASPRALADYWWRHLR